MVPLFVDTVLEIYIKTMIGDEDKEVVAQACMDMADIIKECGYMAVEPCMCLFFLLHFFKFLGVKVLESLSLNAAKFLVLWYSRHASYH